mmetsp:Transcript_19512/g.48948  ORF Transcript_19512/g.48948 Transcript_19512/m.48948 type:complete len:307 (+) Transcript_19512:252-1172(+)
MARVSSVLLFTQLLHDQVRIAAAGEPSCVLSAQRCQKFPSFAGTQFADRFGEELLGAGDTPASCLRRAEDFHHWCGNGRDVERAAVAATHVKTRQTQVFHPTACDPGWSLYDKNCYIHVWRSKTWWDAEAYCNAHGGNLCSIHGKQENEFVFTLTKGLTSWIGYHDVDQDEKHQWTDNTPSNYENKAKNCTGRELDPDCSDPVEVAQQWHDWEGYDAASWVCKKQAKWKLGLLTNATVLEPHLAELGRLNWEDLKKPHPAEQIRLQISSEEEEEEEEASLKEKGALPSRSGGKRAAGGEKKCLNCM